MKVILVTITFVCAYAVCVINMPGLTHAFDKSWDCPPVGKGAVVCIKKH